MEPGTPLRPFRTGSGASRSSRAEPRCDTDPGRSERLAALGRRVAEVVHEVRNPLVPVKTFLDLLASGRDDPELRTGLLEVARDELERVLRLLDALLAQAAGPPEAEATCDAGASCDAGELLEAVRRLLGPRAAEADVRLELALPAELPPLAIGPDALRQVLLNLALNALDATPPGAAMMLRARRLGPAVEIAVDDCGPGIPAALRPRLFEPFSAGRSDRPGGLGLWITRRLVEQAGGTLVAEDRPGGGTRLRLRLPSASEAGGT